MAKVGKTIFQCTIMRGGTSKGIFLMEEDLPRDPQLRDRIILAVFGSPDIRQNGREISQF